MNFSGILQGQFGFGLSGYIKEILNLIYSINTFYLIIILIGGSFFYLKKKYRTKFTFEKPSEFGLIPELAFLSIQGISKVFKFLFECFINPLIILLFIFTYIFNYFFAVKGILLVVFLYIIFFLKMKLMYYNKLVNLAQKNYNYVSTFILFEALRQISTFLVTSIFKSIFLIKILFYLIITIIVLFNDVELFYVWAAVWIIFYFIKTASYYYISELMCSPPKFVTVEYLSGGIEDKLILYDTTSIDYRFKQIDSNDELIIPATAIKKISKNYDIILVQLDHILQIEPENISSLIIKNFKSPFLNSLISAILIPKLNKLKPEAWYHKSVIYSTKNDFNNAKICLEEAVKTNNKYRKIAEFDADFNNIRNEKWFSSIIEGNLSEK